MQDKFSPNKYNRRVNLLQPVAVESAYNETQISFEIARSNYPAHRSDDVTTDGEKQDGKVVQSTNVVEWELRFIPNMGIKSTWKLVDVFTGQQYQIISPVTEIGRRQALRVKTMIVE
jgi:hypothetical protein